MRRFIAITAALLLALFPVFGSADAIAPRRQSARLSSGAEAGLPDDFITGADVSSLLSLEASGRVFYGYDGRKQDLLKTLAESGVNYIRVRVWNDPFDENGNGYGGGNCTIDTAITLGRRAAAYGMGLLVDFHYSDFWADPGKQQTPKAWQNMMFEEKTAAVYDYTAQSLRRLRESGVEVGMVQVGNETTTGFCGETAVERRYALMRTAAQAVRDTDDSILIAVHFTNPEQKNYRAFAQDLQTYNVDYDIFATSFYPEFHGTVDNLKEQLKAVHDFSGKKVMIAETSWAYDSSVVGAYQRSVRGQADEIADCVRAMRSLGDDAVGVFYWEPGWIDVPGDSEEERAQKRDAAGAGWASRYAGAYDPEDAGLYYGATACIPTALFDPNGHPLPSLRTFLDLRLGTEKTEKNELADPSFEDGGSAWTIIEDAAGTVSVAASDARDGDSALHFWSDRAVHFCAEQTLFDLPSGEYAFSLSAQGDGFDDNAWLRIYAVSGEERYEQAFSLDGWKNWKVPLIARIPHNGGEMTVGVEISAAAGAWGTIDSALLIRKPDLCLRGDADGDGEVTIFDVTVIQRYLAGFTLAAFIEEAADVCGDGADITDATAIQRFLAGYENIFHIAETFAR